MVICLVQGDTSHRVMTAERKPATDPRMEPREGPGRNEGSLVLASLPERRTFRDSEKKRGGKEKDRQVEAEA